MTEKEIKSNTETKMEDKPADLQTPEGGASQQKRESPQHPKVAKTEDLREHSQQESMQKTEVKKEVPKVVKKDEAVALGNNLHVSMKQCMYICKFIKGDSVDDAIAKLEDVIKMKRAVPFKGEIPHRSEKGIMSGRYPIVASKIMISVLKGLKGNILANQMDLDKSRIYFASSSWASRPSKRGGARFKRTNVILKAKEMDTKEVPKKVA